MKNLFGNSFFCGWRGGLTQQNKMKKQNNNTNNDVPAWPMAYIRAHKAQQLLANHQLWHSFTPTDNTNAKSATKIKSTRTGTSASPSSSTSPTLHYCINRKAAESLLYQYEDGVRMKRRMDKEIVSMRKDQQSDADSDIGSDSDNGSDGDLDGDEVELENKHHFHRCPLQLSSFSPTMMTSTAATGNRTGGNHFESTSTTAATATATKNMTEKTLIVLHKPAKKTSLLKHALTNVNGNDWRRQRPLVVKALNYKGKQLKQIVEQEAGNFILQCLQSYAPVQQQQQHQQQVQYHNQNKEVTSFLVDIRHVALNVAVETITVAVLSKDHPRRPYLVTKLKKLFLATLRPVHGNPVLAKDVADEIRFIAEELQQEREDGRTPLQQDTGARKNNQSSSSSTSTSSLCLARSLLEQEPSLTREEVLSNIHSSLLAGTQTIATTLVGAIMHMACSPASSSTADTCTMMGTKSPSSRAIINETLRILPPVSSLPRCRVAVTIVDEQKQEEEQHRHNRNGFEKYQYHDCPIDDDVMVIDVLAFAHNNNNDGGGTTCTDDSVKKQKNTKKYMKNFDQVAKETQFALPSWQFNPVVGDDDDGNKKERKNINNSDGSSKRNSEAAPWGIGERACPAGSLSVSALCGVLDAVRCQYTYTTDNSQFNINNKSSSSWMETVSYTPTLIYTEPLMVRFYPKQTKGRSMK